MTAAQSLRIYELTLEFIKDKEKAKEYVAKLEEVVDERVESKTVLIEKIINKDIENMRQEMYKVFLTKDDKVDIIKWIVGLWIAQMAAIIFLIIKK